MSTYAWFACTTCKVHLWLGKAVYNEDKSIHYFHIGAAESPRNSEQPTLNRVLWKMLADHAGHPLRVITPQDAEYQELDAYREIGGDQYGDIEVEDYLRDWRG